MRTLSSRSLLRSLFVVRSVSSSSRSVPRSLSPLSPSLLFVTAIEARSAGVLVPVWCSLTSNDDSVVELPSVTLLLFSTTAVSSSVELSLISREVTLSGMLVELTEDSSDVDAELVLADTEDNVVTLSASSRRGSTEVILSTATVEVSELLRSVVLGLVLVFSVERLVGLLVT